MANKFSCLVRKGIMAFLIMNMMVGLGLEKVLRIGY